MKQIQSKANASLDNAIAMLQNTEDMRLTFLEVFRSQGKQLE